MAEKLKLFNHEIIALRDGLRALDGIPGKMGEVIRFDFSDSLSWNITKNLVIVERAVKVYDMQRNKISHDSGVAQGMVVNEANAEKVGAWKDRMDHLKDEESQELDGLLKLKRVELQKAGKIPPGIMANLFPLLEE